MFPIALQIGNFTIHTYGVMVALGFVSGVLLAVFLARRARLPAEKFVDLGFWSLVFGFLGARGLYVLTQWEYFLSDPSAIIRVWEGGMVFYGGPLLAVPFGIWYVRKHGIPVWSALDIAMPSLALSHFFGRLGCFSVGCCFGRPTELSWAVIFEGPLIDPSVQGVAVHPVQLYEASALLVLVLGLLRVYFRRRFEGQVAIIYLIAYPIVRVVTETFRGDTVRGFVADGALSTSQFISIFVFLVGVVLMVLRFRTVSSAGELDFWTRSNQDSKNAGT